MNWTKFIFASDIHGDQQDPNSVRVLHEFTKMWRPKIRVLGGDAFDFRPLRKKANEDERRESMQKDFEAGCQFITDYRPTHFLLGNHDQRLWDLAVANRGVESDYARQGIEEIDALVSTIHCQILPYHKRDGVLQLGHLKVLHGFYCGITAARQHALVYGACIFGHTHTIDEAAVPGLKRRVARASGCLCSLDLEYASRNPMTLRQAHGFSYGMVNEKTGDFHTYQAEEIAGKWILPSEMLAL